MADKRPILILQMQRMGDLILSYPLMIWLARQYPGHPIFVAAEETFYKPLMPLSPAVTFFPWAGASVLKQHSYELVVNLSIQEKAALLAGEVTADKKIGPVQTTDGNRFVHGDWQLYRTSLVKNNLYNRYHWAELNALDVIPYADIAATRFDTPRTLPTDVNKIGLFLGASEKSKRPSEPFWASLVQELLSRGLRPILFGGPAEKELGNAVVKLSKAPVLNLCGTLGLDELGAAGQTLALFITPDTGPMHLAAWTGLKCLNLSMGNVNPWETGPYQPGHFILRADMDCAKGCWQCTRSRLHCHDPFVPARIAALAARMAAGDTQDKLAKMRLPGLTLFQTGKGETGLYHMKRLDNAPPDDERLISRFWQRFFGSRFGLWQNTEAKKAWARLAQSCPEKAEALLDCIPKTSRQFTHGIKTGSLLDTSFWTSAPPVARPFTGYIQMMLENGDYSRDAWRDAMVHLEALINACR
ncbi:glycosyltransferase family 9 protein [uncultured Pseudodesulfovibrio sp.]|uniref:glycosyltransferase family 9 protein n=1 Tax=uncultured Pseudodesulfovibrio sp. TaxID=2035858 RepID=UPI0029C93D5A|nr:glycosyltransferase family 9 protein [uncultured Pseudodesulfovibrio sp.]